MWHRPSEWPLDSYRVAEAASIEQLFVILSILLSSFAVILLCYIPNGLLLHIRVLIFIR